MLTNRCICCDRILTEAEGAYDTIMNDYNDMCNTCLRTAKDFRYQHEDEVYIIEDEETEEIIDES